MKEDLLENLKNVLRARGFVYMQDRHCFRKPVIYFPGEFSLETEISIINSDGGFFAAYVYLLILKPSSKPFTFATSRHLVRNASELDEVLRKIYHDMKNKCETACIRYGELEMMGL